MKDPILYRLFIQTIDELIISRFYEFFNRFLPGGFNSGRRTMRIPVTLPKVIPEGKIPAIKIDSIICERAEFCIDGQLIFEAALTVPCNVGNASEFENRCLIKARKDAMSTNGVGLGMSLICG